MRWQIISVNIKPTGQKIINFNLFNFLFNSRSRLTHSKQRKRQYLIKLNLKDFSLSIVNNTLLTIRF